MVRLSLILLACVGGMTAAPAFAVKPQVYFQHQQEIRGAIVGSMASVATGDTLRALTDLQARRSKSLASEQAAAFIGAVEQLEEIQKRLQGSK